MAQANASQVELRPMPYAALLAGLATASVAYGVGAFSAVSVLLAGVPVLLVGGLALVSFQGRLTTGFLVALAGILAGYAFLGRGFAHLGAPPLYLAEPVLFVGLTAVAF